MAAGSAGPVERLSAVTPDDAKALREPFASHLVGKLPKPTKRDNQKGKCKECDGWHGLPAVHLDYVGHSAITDRLLQVDPTWTWEPVAADENGAPHIAYVGTDANLWIRLTVCGVTRYGVGTEDRGATDLAKKLISDALRNASMRFGLALDLWSKEDLLPVEETDTPAPPKTAKKTEPKSEAKPKAARPNCPICTEPLDGGPVTKQGSVYAHSPCVVGQTFEGAKEVKTPYEENEEPF